MARVAELAKPDVDRVIVLHVHEAGSGAGGRAPQTDLGCLAAVVARTLHGVGLPAESMSVVDDLGDLAAAIAVVAGEVHADIVVVGDSPTWLSTHQGVRSQVEELLPGARVVKVRTLS